MFSEIIPMFQMFGAGVIIVKGTSEDNGKSVEVTGKSGAYSVVIENEVATISNLPGKASYVINITDGETTEVLKVSLGYGETKVVYTSAAEPVAKVAKQVDDAIGELNTSINESVNGLQTNIDSLGASLKTKASTSELEQINKDLSKKLTELEEHMDYKKPLGKDGYYKYTVVINEAYADGDPDGMVTYEDNAKMFIKGDPAWDKVFGHYPCVFKAGEEVYKLDRDDFTKKENGSAATITGADGDVMIAFPKMGYRIERMGNNVVISITDNPNDPDYKYYAWTKGTTVKDKFYFGAFEGWNDSGKLRSISNSKTPTANQTIGTFRTQANAVGSGYNIQGWHQWVYLQCMYVMKYGNLNSQATIGVGRQSGESLIAIGGSEKYGMDSEIIKKEYATYMTDSAHHVKCFGIEDLWANCWDWTDGFGLDSSGKALVSLTNNNFNDSKTGYTQTNAIVTGWSDSKPKSVQGTTELGFVGRLTGGGDNAYYCDSTWSSTNTVACVGGRAWYGASCGVFALSVGCGASDSRAGLGARLMYL